MRTTSWKTVAFALVGFLGIAVLVGWLGYDRSQAGPPDMPSAKPERKTAGSAAELPAVIEPIEQTDVHARISGVVQKVLVDIGAPVKKGQLLAELFVPEMEAELAQKKAEVRQAEARIEQARRALAVTESGLATRRVQVEETEAGIKHAQANLERWETEYKRLADLVEKNVIDRRTLEETHKRLAAAKVAHQKAQTRAKITAASRDERAAKRQKAQADLLVAEAALEVAKADMSRTAALLQHAQLKAPFDGIVTRRTASVGTVCHPGTDNKPAPLFVVARIDAVRVVASVPEADAAIFKTNVPTAIRVPALQGRKLAGKVTRSAGAFDPKTRTLRVEIDLPNPEGQLRPGMYATVAVEGASRPSSKETDEVQALKKARLEAAHKAYEVALESMQQTKREGGLVIPLARSQDVYHWSVRWLNAQRDLDGKKSEQVAAAESHLKRIKDLQQRVTVMHKGGLVPPLDPSAVEFYRAEAEIWLAQEKAQ